MDLDSITFDHFVSPDDGPLTTGEQSVEDVVASCCNSDEDGDNYDVRGFATDQPSVKPVSLSHPVCKRV